MTRPSAWLVVAGLLLTATGWDARGATAQEVVLAGAADVAVDQRLARLLDASPLVVSRDTTIEAGDTIRRSVLVLDATIVHEGVILGDLVGVDAGAFVRPSAVVSGDLVNIAGGLYRSEIADVGGRIIDLPTAGYRVVREPGLLRIEATATESRLELEGAYGLHAPTYDRVNGLTAVWGAAYRLPRVERLEPRVRGRVGWQTQRGDPTYHMAFSVRRGATEVALGHERTWDTRERWIRSDLLNSLGYLWDGADYRDYHEMERSWGQLSRALADGTGRLRTRVTLRAQIEDAASLAAGAPWFFFGSDTRPNPPIDDGRTTSFQAEVDLGWEGEETRFSGRFEAESARPILDSDFEFALVRARGSWAMLAFADHTLTIDYLLQRPLGSRPLPRQRWSFVGGPHTLYTLPLAEFYGDHVVFVGTDYVIPLPERLALPLVGAPRVRLQHAAGMAWSAGEDRSLHQEVALRVDLAILYARYAMVPDDPGTTDFSIGFAWPFGRRFPWE